MTKHVIGYVCLPLGLLSFFGGLHLSQDTPLGYGAIVAGIALAVVAFRLLGKPAKEP